ncbi:unnamed protein product [Symbiodinium sp. KB8]|nr:unnamed protein product [Symbiodinium sp. KB8]
MAYASSLGRPWTPSRQTPRARRMTGWVELRNGLGPAQEIFPAYLDKDTKAEGLWGHRPLSGHPFHNVCPGGQFLAHPPNSGRYSPDMQSETVASYYSATRFKKPDLEPLPQQATNTGHGRYSGWCDNEPNFGGPSAALKEAAAMQFRTTYKEFHDTGYCQPRVRPATAKRRPDRLQNGGPKP